MIENAEIELGESAASRYGHSTAAAVLAYKRRRNIINPRIEKTADNIVGKMTIESLDREMQLIEQRQFQLAAVGVPFLRSLFFAPVAATTVRGIVVSEMNRPWLAWARTFAKTFERIGAGIVTIPNGVGIGVVAAQLKKAAMMAGPRGFLILSVGHGGHGQAAFADEGFFDLGPHRSFRVGGQNSVLPGDPPPAHQDGPVIPSDVSAFYDVPPQDTIVKPQSRKDRDEAKPSDHNAQLRLSNFRHYEDVANTFRGTGLSGVILLTCKCGLGSGFIRRVRQQWGVPIIAYTRRIFGQEQSNGRTRIFLEGDALGTGTNTPFGEFLFPMSRDMVTFF